MTFNVLALFLLLTSVTGLFLCGLIIYYGQAKLHKIWALFNFSISAWAFFAYLAITTRSPEQSYLFWKIAHGFGIYVSIFFFHTVSIFCQLNSRKLIIASYAYGLIFNFLNFFNNGNFIYQGVTYLFNSMYYLQAKNLPWLLALSPWLLLAIFGSYQLFRYHQIKKDPSGEQAWMWGIITMLGYIGGTSTFIPMLRIDFYPSTMFFLSIYATITTYIVFRYEFFSLRIILEKSIIYSILLTFISIFYLVSVVCIEKLTQHFLGYTSVTISISSAFLIGILFIPLRNQIQLILDRTLFKRTQSEFAEENELLRREISDKEKFRAVATLASSLAHEIKNPLTALKTFSEFLPARMNDPQFVELFNKTTARELGRIEQLTRELLDFAKPSPLAIAPADIHQTIDSTLSLLSSELQKHKITLERRFDPAVPEIPIDANQIKQALLNIFLNAIEIMPEGGNLIISTCGQRTTNSAKSDRAVRSTHDASCIIISITDTGPGIPESVLENIFKPFFTTKSKGTGLGLAITKDIIEQHHGRIKINSKIGRGTEVMIELPIKKELK